MRRNLLIAAIAVSVGLILQSCKSSNREKKEDTPNAAQQSTSVKSSQLPAASDSQSVGQKNNGTITSKSGATTALTNNNGNVATPSKRTSDGPLLAQNKIYHVSKNNIRPIGKAEIESDQAKEGNDEAREDEKNEDGIRESQEREFQITRDPQLNVIPKQRLVEATRAVAIQRQQAKVSGFAALPAAPGSLSSWTERGPYYDTTGPSNGNTRPPNTSPKASTSGRMRAILVDKADPTNKTVWVGGIDGGVWKTNDVTAFPATWTLINDFLGNLAVADIVQDPTNTNIMYFGTGEKTYNVDAVRGGGVWKSTDHGQTWNLLPSTTAFWNVSRMAVDKNGYVYVATIGNAQGIQRSKDGGNTWTGITPTTSGPTIRVCEMKMDPNTGRLHILKGYYNAAAASCGYFYTDRPDTVSSSGWVYRRTPFSDSTALGGTPVYNCELTISTNNVLYALPANASFQTPYVYRSVDGGDNWVQANATSLNAGANALSSGQGWYNLAIGVDPANPANIVAGGLNTFRSSDSGKTWTEVAAWVTGAGANQYVHADNHYITWAANQVLLGCDGGLFYSPDGGVTWSDRNNGLRLKQFYAVDIHPTLTNYLIGGAQDNGCHILTQPGLSMSTEFIGGDGFFVHIDQDEPQYQYGSYTYNTYRRSTNGGSTWSTVTYGSNVGQFINPSEFDNLNNRMYAAGNAGQYVRWDDPHTGSTFVPVSISAFNGAQVASVSVSSYTQNRIFFGTAGTQTIGARVVKIDNAQSTSPIATDITNNITTGYVNVSCVALGYNDNNIIATISNYGVAKVWNTINGGTTWTNITGNLPDVPVRWAIFYPEDSTRAMIATEMGVFSTNQINGTSTVWTQDPTFPVVRTDMIKYRKADGTFAAATHGRGMWTTTLPLQPYVRFAASSSTQQESTTNTTGCRNYTDYTVNMNIDVAPTGNASVNLALAPGGAARQGVDFDFTTNGNFTSPSNALTFASGSTTSQPITVRVYDDIEVNGTRSFTLNYTVSGSTNAMAAPSSPSYTFTILDNDTIPTGSPRSTIIWADNFENGINGWYIIQPSSGARNAWLFTSGCNAGINNVTGEIVQYATTSPSCGSRANTLSNSYLLREVNATGLNSLSVKFTYKTGADGANQTAQLVASTDGGNTWGSIATYTNTSSATTVTQNLPDSLSNKDFYLGWMFTSTATAPALSTSFGIDEITVSGNRAAITADSIAGDNLTAYVASDTGTNYFLTSSGNTILASLRGVGATLGCTTASLDSAGTTWQAFSNGLRSQKVISITPSTNGSTASYTVGLYFTAAELGGTAPGTVKIAKSDATNLSAANSSNTTLLATSFVPYGSGYLFTANATGFSKFFLANSSVTLPVTLNSFNGYLDNQGHSTLRWTVGMENNLSSYEVERSYDNIQFTPLGSVPATGASSYSFTDPVLALPSNYYRLKIVDVSGKFVYSSIVLVTNKAATEFVKLLGNPVTSQISLLINNKANDNVNASLISMNGQVIKQWNLGKAEGNVILPLNNTPIASGIYILTITAGNQKVDFKIIKR